MADYACKIRVRKRGLVYIIEELVPTATGRYFVKRRLPVKGTSLKEVLRNTEGLDAFVAGDLVA